VLNVNPYPDDIFPSTALVELQVDEVNEVNPTRAKFDIATEEKPDPKIVKLESPLDGAFVIDIEEADPGTTNEMLNKSNPTATETLTTTCRTDWIPEATLKVKELSENQCDLSEVDPCSFGCGEALNPKYMPNTEMPVLPDDETELAILTLDTRGTLYEQIWVMVPARRCELVDTASVDLLP